MSELLICVSLLIYLSVVLLAFGVAYVGVSSRGNALIKSCFNCGYFENVGLNSHSYSWCDKSNNPSITGLREDFYCNKWEKDKRNLY